MQRDGVVDAIAEECHIAAGTAATALLATALRDIAPEVDLGAVDRDLPLQEVANLDSISFMALVTAIHDRTGIQIPFQDYPKLATLNSFVTYLMAPPHPIDSV